MPTGFLEAMGWAVLAHANERMCHFSPTQRVSVFASQVESVCPPPLFKYEKEQRSPSDSYKLMYFRYDQISVYGMWCPVHQGCSYLLKTPLLS